MNENKSKTTIWLLPDNEIDIKRGIRPIIEL